MNVHICIGIQINTTASSATWVFNDTTEGTTATAISMISRCFACAGRIAPSLPSTIVTQAVLELDTWDYGVNSSSASFVHAMAGYRYDDELPADYPPSIIDNAQMIARVANWLGGSQRPYMIYQHTSPASDPLLYLHLTFVDKLTNSWLSDHSNTIAAEHDIISDTRMGGTASQCTAPFLPLLTNQQLYTHHNYLLGYQYE